ncbi:MmgE/PrpD family protein [Caballeronia sp. ATUFL_M1_KS5A]|uniref:MmgE/PrpD family protein n=1 Tax=Caballeronia sp. ATUFL_M1_KS5A TaxID=2921778 RepID=UPI002027F780|nr:MmgE/PrpD family protein [Caballeronia sp. ATUFL_M1_KS5A]
MTATYVERLGAFIASRKADSMTETVRQKLQSCLLFNLSVAFGAPHADAVRLALEALHAASGNAACWRTGASLTPADAAFRNAALISARGQNDTHAAINGHIGCVAIPAVFALAQATGATAADVRAALLCAYDVAPLIAHDAAMKSGERGFRGTSLYGVFAAAAGAARVLRLDARQCAVALSLASQFCGGTMQCWAEGTPEWLMQVGLASRAGVVAALLAQDGMTATSLALEGPNGFYRAFSGAIPDWHWDGEPTNEILNVTFKPFPGCTINQLPVKTLLDCKAREAFNAAEVEHMSLALHPAYARYPGIDRYGPFDSAASAIMSAPYMLQCALVNGTLTLSDFTPDTGATSLHASSRRVAVVADESLAPFHCRIDIGMRDGRAITALSEPPSALSYSFGETVSLTEAISEEWRIRDRRSAHARLTDRIVSLCSDSASARTFTDLFDAGEFHRLNEDA